MIPCPWSLCVHPTFHVSKLKLVRESLLVPPTKPLPPNKMVDSGPIYTVKKLVAVKKRGQGDSSWLTGRGTD
ncbi:hypothetical protein L3Q82_017279 [Scortum barcoo]|uniref:Uncharacterized protein n=1 Tax=Scortum barcoo TaxID=214431 RepID=A0ACB8VK52_9TELE|nr:hypothetical protein L3Q82_017279 [Scortum barcoo]